MPSPKRAPGGAIPFSIDPGQLPDDGSPVTFEQTFAKRLGPQSAQQNPMTEEDYELFDWQLEHQLPNGRWTFVRKIKGRPYPHTMGEADPGNYRATPIDRSGRPVEQMTKTFSIGNPVASLHSMPPQQMPQQMDMPRSHDEPSTAMPAWMQVLFQREAEERAEQRRRAEDDARRREAWEREQALKEEARREREERRAEMQAEREALARKEAADRTNALIMAGMQLAQQFVGKQAQQAPSRGDDRVQELLLQHVLRERAAPPPPSGGLKESLELLVTLDQVAQSRADRLPPPAEEKGEEDMGSTMMKMLPMLIGGAAAARGGGGEAPAPAINVDAIINQAMQNPQVLARIAAQNPEAIARTFSKVVKSDKRIEDAVIKVLSEDDEDEAGE